MDVYRTNWTELNHEQNEISHYWFEKDEDFLAFRKKHSRRSYDFVVSSLWWIQKYRNYVIKMLQALQFATKFYSHIRDHMSYLWEFCSRFIISTNLTTLMVFLVKYGIMKLRTMSVKSYIRFVRTTRVRLVLLTFAKARQFLNSSIFPRRSNQIEIFSYFFLF